MNKNGRFLNQVKKACMSRIRACKICILYLIDKGINWEETYVTNLSLACNGMKFYESSRALLLGV